MPSKNMVSITKNEALLLVELLSKLTSDNKTSSMVRVVAESILAKVRKKL